MNRTNVSVAIASLSERLSALVTLEVSLAFVHSANVTSQLAPLTEFLVAFIALVLVRLVRIVNALDVLTKRLVARESSQTNRTLRSILPIINRFLA